MNPFAPSSPVSARAPFALLSATFEVFAYLCLVGTGTLCFLLGWITTPAAGVLTILLLVSLTILAWVRFDEGRHPCFLFLCTLSFFQGSGLLAELLGAENDALRVQVMTPNAFYVSQDEAGLVLLLLALSAICVYAPCRWNYRPIPPPSDEAVRRYLPYLYLLFFASLPIQLFKNYRYYEYVQEHGGYTFIYVNHAALAASVPFLVRVIPLLTFPVFVAIFVFERRKKPLFVVTALYFLTASLILLLGSRVATFSLILVLWYVARIKSTKKIRTWKLVALGLMLLMAGDEVSRLRENLEVSVNFDPLQVLAAQGTSLQVTEVMVKYRDLFSPHVPSYMLTEVKNAFVATDASNYYRGRSISYDISLFLNPSLFAWGFGTGSSCVGEAYVIGGLLGVVIILTLMGFGLRVIHRFSRNALSLVVVALVLPEVLMMPRNGLLDWISVLMRSAISFLLLALGWQLYRLFASIGKRPAGMTMPLLERR
jgi:oligosaccharide repeat unit polymerase